MEGAQVIFSQSIHKYKLQYNLYISDGDSKEYTAVCNNQPYGVEYYIEKEECVGHIPKRMGRRPEIMQR